MKILHIINTLDQAGAERLLVDIAIKTKKMGHEVSVIALSGKPTCLTQEMQAAGIIVTHLQSAKYNPFVIFRLKKYLRTPEIVHVHLFPAQYYVAVAKRLFRKKFILITTEHNTYNKRSNLFITRFTDNLAYNSYHRIICISEATFDYMKLHQKRSSAFQQKLRLIPNGIDIERFSCAKADRKALFSFIPDTAFVVSQVARFQQQKDQDTLIRAISLLPNDVHAVFVGEGERISQCKDLAQQLAVADRVHFLGIRNDVPQIIASSDLIVMSSHWEGFGLAALEGMAAQKVVLASDVEGLAQVVNNPELLFSVGDYQLLAKKILNLRNHPNQRKELARQCSNQAQYFSLDKTTQSYIGLYQETLKERVGIDKSI